MIPEAEVRGLTLVSQSRESLKSTRHDRSDSPWPCLFCLFVFGFSYF